ncbi:MAG: sugar phosphate isomerase/epimerase [Deltaproteobacteria bacterium]|nr:sugar phosphate isomerase/epimerase [Deltaproteobacteria bacterium]
MIDLSKAVHVSVPFFMLRDQYLPLVLENRISLEIGLDAQVLDTCPPGDLRRIAGELQAADLNCSFHAPFLDLSPGAIDPRIRQISRERLEQVLELIPVFQPRWVVCHLAYEARHYQDDLERWQGNCLDTFSGWLNCLQGADVPLMVENVYEKEPDHLVALFRAIPDPRLRFCLDVGHHRLYARSDLQVWIDQLGPYLGLLHLHDNYGQMDDHLALGSGTIDFPAFFELLKSRGLRPRITIEPHQEDWVRESLVFLANHYPWP